MMVGMRMDKVYPLRKKTSVQNVVGLSLSKIQYVERSFAPQMVLLFVRISLTTVMFFKAFQISKT